MNISSTSFMIIYISKYVLQDVLQAIETLRSSSRVHPWIPSLSTVTSEHLQSNKHAFYLFFKNCICAFNVKKQNKTKQLFILLGI